MAGNDCMASIQACMMRVARLASDGTTPSGATNGYISDRLVKVDLNPSYETGDEITLKTGCGNIAVAYKDLDRLKRIDVSLTTATVDPELWELLTGGSLITVGGQSNGYAAPAVGASPTAGVSLEFWSKAWSGGGGPPGQTFTDGVTNTTATVTSATAAFTSADVGRTITGSGIPANTTISSVTNATTIIMSAVATLTATGVSITIGRPGAYFRWALPKVVMKLETQTLDDGAKVNVFSGPAFENAAWANGPFNDWPSGATSGRVFAFTRETTLPTSACGYATVPAQ